MEARSGRWVAIPCPISSFWTVWKEGIGVIWEKRERGTEEERGWKGEGGGAGKQEGVREGERERGREGERERGREGEREKEGERERETAQAERHTE